MNYCNVKKNIMGKEREVRDYVKLANSAYQKKERQKLIKEVGGPLLALGGLILNHWLNKKKK